MCAWQGPLGDSRALSFPITHDPPGLNCGSKFLPVQSKHFVLVQLWTIANLKVENCLDGFFDFNSFISAMNVTFWFYIGL